MSTILIGVDATDRSEDAIAFGRRLAEAARADVIVACAYPYLDVAGRAANATFREALAEEATTVASDMRERLGGLPAHIRVKPNPSPAHALHDLAESERATLVVVGSTHTGHAGRVLPGSTGERLLHGSPCAVAVVPKGYRKRAAEPITRIGVAYNASEEATAAVTAAAGLARALAAELELIGVAGADTYGAPTLMGGPSVVMLREDIERHVREGLDAALATVPDDVPATAVLLSGAPADRLVDHSRQLDLLVCGSRGYGPLRSVLVGGVSGRLMRSAHCPVIVVPRGIDASPDSLFESAAATAA